MESARSDRGVPRQCGAPARPGALKYAARQANRAARAGAGRHLAGLLGSSLWLALACTGCSGPPSAGRQLGDDLGGFQVSASETANGCGAGALGSTPSFEFEIDLARDQGELFWGGQGSARLDEGLGFELVDTIRVELTPPRGGQPGCSIQRSDRIAGTLTPNASGEIVGFGARLEHTFAVAAGGLCSLDDRLAAGLPQLPCSILYALDGERWREPESAP